MTCRHRPGDLSCSRYGYGGNAPETPDVDRFEILDARPAGGDVLVVKVQYPNCLKCAYEGVKILVYEHTTMLDALRWRRIDPHFRSPEVDPARTSAPPPVARFPGTIHGWNRALAFAALLKVEMGG